MSNEEDFKTKGAKTIMDTNYPKTNFVIENLIPSCGLVIFAGAPKIGKGWFFLQLFNNLYYTKENFIGHKILSTCKCLYLALEDSEKRIQDRILKQGILPDNDKLSFACEWSTNEKGVNKLRRYLKLYPETKLICIDTKGKFSEGRTEESFQSDYTWMSELKKLADELQVAIILVTHLRKKKPDEDPYEAISGSSANMAAADTTIMLKKARNQNKGTLFLTSRDFQEKEEDIFFEYATCTWNAANESIKKQDNLTPERLKILDAIEEEGGEASPSQIAEKIGGTAKNISNMLTTMRTYGFVTIGTKRGYWALPDNDDEEEII